MPLRSFEASLSAEEVLSSTEYHACKLEEDAAAYNEQQEVYFIISTGAVGHAHASYIAKSYL